MNSWVKVINESNDNFYELIITDLIIIV